MKQYWQRLATRIDALSLRERVVIFAMAALILVVLVNTAVLNPQYQRQRQLSQRIAQEQSIIAGLQAEIQQKVSSSDSDPDRLNRTRLEQLKQESAQMQARLRNMQKGLVSPDKMSQLLEDILKQNSGLQLVSLKTLPVSSLTESATGKADGKPADRVEPDKNKANGVQHDRPPVSSVYKHSVEIVVQGGYFDIMRYLAQMEAMPWQIFWGRARLNVDEYPKSTLTLTLFTLSLDEKWLNL